MSQDATPYTVICHDFRFDIDASRYLIPEDNPPLWLVADTQPAFRGSTSLQVDESLNRSTEKGDAETGEKHPLCFYRRLATSKERSSAKYRLYSRFELGIPQWSKLQGHDESTIARLESEVAFQDYQFTVEGSESTTATGVYRSGKSLDDWAEEYCRDWRPWKEFRLRKEVYGWNLRRLQADIHQSLPKPRFDTLVSVAASVCETDVVVRKSPMPTNKWILGLLWITLIYPLIIAPLQFLFLTAKWEVCGTSFAFRRWRHMEDSRPGETVDAYKARQKPQFGEVDPNEGDLLTQFKVTSKGISQLIGTPEAIALATWKEEGLSSGSINPPSVLVKTPAPVYTGNREPASPSK